MMNKAVNQRKYSRVTTVPHAIPEATPGHPLVINVSQGGACLWLSEPPPAGQVLALRFRCDGQDHVLQSRLVWSRRRAATSIRKNPPRSEGWLAGVAFTGGDGDIEITEIPRDVLRADHAAVSFIGKDDGPVGQHRNRDRQEESPRLITLNEDSISGIKAATGELVPVFAKHFSNVRLVFTRERLEISASFKPPEHPGAPQMQRRNDRNLQQTQMAPESVSSRVDRPPVVTRPGNVPTTDWHRRGYFAIAAVVIVGASYLGLLGKPDDNPGPTDSIVARQHIPDWAQGLGLDSAVLDEWIEVKRTFNLPDTTLRSAIQIVRDNDKYPSAHDLHDLARHPVQVGRAFSLLAGARTTPATSLELRALKDDLESRLMAGARFPDEAPGGRHSSLQRELYHNVIVLGVVDLLYRRQGEPEVNEILVVIQGGGSKGQKQGA